jgi:hypothetical protein
MVVVWYAFATMRLTAGTRVWIAGIAVATYFLARRIVTQIAIEVLRGKTSRSTPT